MKMEFAVKKPIIPSRIEEFGGLMLLGITSKKLFYSFKPQNILAYFTDSFYKKIIYFSPAATCSNCFLSWPVSMCSGN